MKIKQYLLMSLSILSISCSNIDFELPKGPQGEKGNDGLSAYELWKDGVNQGIIEWQEDTQINDFFRFLKGKDGKNGKDGKDGKDGHNGLNGTNGVNGHNGKSAYELWKEDVIAGKMPSSKEPNTFWDRNRHSEVDFWNFLMGKNGVDGKDGINGINGINGKDGKSTYELWKEDLHKRENTDNPLMDNRTKKPWNPQKDKLSDFYEYLVSMISIHNNVSVINGGHGNYGTAEAIGGATVPTNPSKPIGGYHGADAISVGINH